MDLWWEHCLNEDISQSKKRKWVKLFLFRQVMILGNTFCTFHYIQITAVFMHNHSQGKRHLAPILHQCCWAPYKNTHRDIFVSNSLGLDHNSNRQYKNMVQNGLQLLTIHANILHKHSNEWRSKTTDGSKYFHECKSYFFFFLNRFQSVYGSRNVCGCVSLFLKTHFKLNCVFRCF